jgi:PAS domain S-box-containing protein
MEEILAHAEEIKSLQRCMNDLISVLALPAMWIGGDPSRIIGTLVDALLGMLDLDVAYARLDAPREEGIVEILRVASSLKASTSAQDLRDLLRRVCDGVKKGWPAATQERIAGGAMAVVPFRLGLHDETGLLVVGSRRHDFPSQTESLLLSVAANQAAIGLQEEKLLSQQKRAAAELDQRVAQRTRELVQAMDALQLRVGMLQQLPVAAWSVTPDGTPDIINQAWFDYRGESPEDSYSHADSWIVALHPDDKARAVQSYWEGIRSGRGFTVEARFLRARDQSYRWHLNRAVPVRDAAGNILRFVGTSTDIEDLKQTQERLRESQRSLWQMSETIPEMLWSATAEGSIDYCNGRLLEYTGFSAEEVMGSVWTKIVHPEDVEHTVRTWLSSVQTGVPYRVEARTFHAADCTYRWCVTSALPLLDEDGRILKWYGTVVDMHDWRQSQEDLRQTQTELAHMARVMTMGELTASIAHEVNQPLSGIITNANTCLRMLAGEPPNVDGARETARRTIRDGNRAYEVISRLRSLFAKKEIRAEPVDLNEATQEVVALCGSMLQKNQVSLRLDLAANLPPVKGDRVQLQQVILNLLTNASDATAVVQDRPREITVRTEEDGHKAVRLLVRDTGPGFDPHSPEDLFTAFYTTKNGGMGIGLSVSRSIIEGHGGRLWATQNDGPGATFLFSMPS